jgi:hypothetical protein
MPRPVVIDIGPYKPDPTWAAVRIYEGENGIASQFYIAFVHRLHPRAQEYTTDSVHNMVCLHRLTRREMTVEELLEAMQFFLDSVADQLDVHIEYRTLREVPNRPKRKARW